MLVGRYVYNLFDISVYYSNYRERLAEVLNADTPSIVLYVCRPHVHNCVDH